METSTRHMDKEENKLKNKKKIIRPNEVMNVSQQKQPLQLVTPNL
jgi:hypothetical protein